MTGDRRNQRIGFLLVHLTLEAATGKVPYIHKKLFKISKGIPPG
jgi:hypothetical protein